MTSTDINGSRIIILTEAEAILVLKWFMVVEHKPDSAEAKLINRLKKNLEE